MAKVRTDDYDSKGNEAMRVLSQSVIHKVTPAGNFCGGPGIVNIMRLVFYHRFGRILMRLKVRFPGFADSVHRVLFK